MLLSFSVKNYLSYKDLTTISFEATSVREKNTHTFQPTHSFDIRLLKSLSLYGYNSSGKSNLIKGFAYLKHAILNSNNPGFNFDVTPFLLDGKSIELPSSFEVIFFIDDIKYRYGFDILQNKIDSEWLFQTEPKTKENHLFVRSSNGVLINKNWNKRNKNVIEPFTNLLKTNTLLVSTLGQLNINPITSIINWFANVKFIDGLQERDMINYTAELMKDEYYKHNILRIIKNAKLGFENIIVKKNEAKSIEKYHSGFTQLMYNSFETSDNYEIFTVHNKYINDTKVDTQYFNLLTEESTGTKKFFGLIGVFIEAIFNRQILVIDELDTKFHSSMLEIILLFFNNPKFNTKGAQLFFTSHSTYLMRQNTLRRDQIYFLDKAKTEESKLTRAHGGSQKIRTDASIEKEYFSGNLGGIQQLDINFFSDNIETDE